MYFVCRARGVEDGCRMAIEAVRSELAQNYCVSDANRIADDVERRLRQTVNVTERPGE